LSPKDTGRAHMFSLEPLALPASAALPFAPTLVVALPTSAPDLDTHRIALTHADGRHDYYAGARWVDFLPALIQDSLIKTFERSGAFHRVTTEGGRTDDWQLKLEVRSFQADYRKGVSAPRVRVFLAVTVKRPGATLLPMTFKASGEAAAASDSLADIQTAFAMAFSDAQRDIALRVLEKDN